MNTLHVQTSAVNTQIINSAANMLASALWYARHGLAVFACHVPIHSADGACIGCTCEFYRTSEECRVNHPRMYLGPNGKCENPGKCPTGRWRDRSTTDEAQIRRWWAAPWRVGDVQFYPNIGIDCDKSDLLVLDGDAYKESYAGANLLSLTDRQTVTALTGGGGEHLLYDRRGLPYGNDTKGLPAGIDVRGVGGYIVAAPSLHKSGRRYQWETGYGPHEIIPLPIPDTLKAILDTAHNGKQARQAEAINVTFAAIDPTAPDLAQWNLLASAVEKIHQPSPKGARSEHDFAVVMSLLRAGATNEDILAVFTHYPVGAAGKFGERGPDYLALTIQKCRAELDHTRATLANLPLWGQTHSFAEFIPAELRGRHYRTDSVDTKVFDAVCDLFSQAGQLRAVTGKRRLAALAGCSANSVVKALARLAAIFSVTPGDRGMVIELRKDFSCAHFDPWLSLCHVTTPVSTIVVDLGVKVRARQNEYSPRKATDPFLSGTSRTVKERARDASIVAGGTYLEWLATIPKGLGESTLRVLDALQRCGDLTAQELATETGKTCAAIRRACLVLVAHGLIESEEVKRFTPKTYSLAGDVWRKVDDLAPTLRTYKLGAEREAKRLQEAQKWATNEQMAAIEAGNEAAHDKIEHRLTRLGNERLKVLGHIYPQMAPADLATLAMDVQLPSGPHPALVAKMKRYRADARLAADAERKQRKSYLASESLRLWVNGADKHDAAQQLMSAGYTPTEAWTACNHAWRDR